jgi:hypothetical protein
METEVAPRDGVIVRFGAIEALVTMATLTMLALVLGAAVLPASEPLAAAHAAQPPEPAVCIASAPVAEARQGGDGREIERAAFVRAVGGCMTTMHDAMASSVAGARSADAAFVAAMLPHHQGGVDMARQLLLHGRDPELRALALGVIAEQQAEIEMLRVWLARNGYEAGAVPRQSTSLTSRAERGAPR